MRTVGEIRHCQSTTKHTYSKTETVTRDRSKKEKKKITFSQSHTLIPLMFDEAL